MWRQIFRTVPRLLYIGMVNVLILLVLFSLAEFWYRVHREGVKTAFVNLANYMVAVPYSNLGTGNWVIHDETLGYRLNPEKSGINSLSVRHNEVVTPKPQGLYRIVVLGDSIPYDKPGFVNYTSEKLSRDGNFELINSGIPGYTTYQELVFFKTYLLHTEPDLVIWTYCLNDNHKFLHRFDEKAQMLWTEEALESLKATSLLDKLVSRSYLLSELKLRILAIRKQRQECRFPWECVPDFHIAWKDEPWARYEEYLGEMNSLVHQMNGKLAIVIFPYEPQLEHFARTRDTEYVLKPQAKVNALCLKYNVPCLDLFPAFAKQQKAIRLFRDGVHLTEEGHHLTATLIHAFLLEKDLLSPVRSELRTTSDVTRRRLPPE